MDHQTDRKVGKVERKSRKDADLNRFLRGLKEYNLTHEDLFKKFEGRFKYIGGREGSPRNYYNMLKKTEYKWLPEIKDIKWKDRCSCGAEVVLNYYVLDTLRKKIYVIGSKCIERFNIGLYRSCRRCGGKHQRQLSDECMKCYKEIPKNKKIMNKVLTEI